MNDSQGIDILDGGKANYIGDEIFTIFQDNPEDGPQMVAVSFSDLDRLSAEIERMREAD